MIMINKLHTQDDQQNINLISNLKTKYYSRYKDWLEGKDLGYHPVDDPKTSSMSVAAPPSAEEFLINKTNEQV